MSFSRGPPPGVSMADGPPPGGFFQPNFGPPPPHSQQQPPQQQANVGMMAGFPPSHHAGQLSPPRHGGPPPGHQSQQGPSHSQAPPSLSHDRLVDPSRRPSGSFHPSSIVASDWETLADEDQSNSSSQNRSSALANHWGHWSKALQDVPRGDRDSDAQSGPSQSQFSRDPLMHDRDPARIWNHNPTGPSLGGWQHDSAGLSLGSNLHSGVGPSTTSTSRWGFAREDDDDDESVLGGGGRLSMSSASNPLGGGPSSFLNNRVNEPLGSWKTSNSGPPGIGGLPNFAPPSLSSNSGGWGLPPSQSQANSSTAGVNMLQDRDLTLRNDRPPPPMGAWGAPRDHSEDFGSILTGGGGNAFNPHEFGSFGVQQPQQQQPSAQSNIGTMNARAPQRGPLPHRR